VLGWLAVTVAALGGVADLGGLHWVQSVEWPTDLYTLGRLEAEPIDVAVVGTSRSHYGLPPSGLDQCLSKALERPTRSVGLNRLTASAYTLDIVAREVLADRPPRVLVVEVAPETLNAEHFEQDLNLASSAHLQDMPECLATARSPRRLTSCVRPLFRGVENVAHLLARPFGDHDHITWMATYAGGGQYCYDDDACLARNAAYDRKMAGRWQQRMDTLVPRVRDERFRDYTASTGLNIDHFRALLDRETALGVHVVVVNLPVSAAYQAQVPEGVYRDYMAALDTELGPRGVPLVDLNTPTWQDDRALWLDPDHLNSVGAQRLTQALCDTVLVDLLR
jgi:hypothetical protein